jgi:rubrerythrin
MIDRHFGDYVLYCDVCGAEPTYNMNPCPYCGQELIYPKEVK